MKTPPRRQNQKPVCIRGAQDCEYERNVVLHHDGAKLRRTVPWSTIGTAVWSRALQQLSGNPNAKHIGDWP